MLQGWLGPVARNTLQVEEHSLLGSESSSILELPLPSPSASPSAVPHKSLSHYLFPRPSAAYSIPKWTAINHEMLNDLFHCIEHNTCAQNQTKGKHFQTLRVRGIGNLTLFLVVILSSHEFRFELLGENGGEKIW